MNIEFYKEEIYKEAMEKEAIWTALAEMAAKALPAIANIGSKAAPLLAKAAPIAKSVLTKDLAKSVASGATLGAGFGALTTPEDRVGGAVKGALSWGPMAGVSHIGLKNVVPALAKTQVGKSIMASDVGKYVAARPRLANVAKGAVGDAAAFGALGALPTKENQAQYGTGIGGTVNSVANNALLGGAFGGVGGAFTKVPKKAPNVSWTSSYNM